MTEDEKKSAVKTGRIIRARRKSLGWTQLDAAKKIGLSQSALSKMESGLLIPSVHQWFEFCEHAKIPTDSHILAHLDQLKPTSLHIRVPESDFKMNQAYLDYAGSTARSLLPVLKWTEQKLGPKKTQELWKFMGVDPDYFIDLSNPINFRFFSDLSAQLMEKGVLKRNDFSLLTKPVSDFRNHGLLNQTYSEAKDPESLLTRAFSGAAYYEVNFNYRLESVSRKKIVFSATPAAHLLEIKNLRWAECETYLPEYRAQYFKNLLSALPESPVPQIQEKDGVYEIRYR